MRIDKKSTTRNLVSIDSLISSDAQDPSLLRHVSSPQARRAVVRDDAVEVSREADPGSP